VNDFLNIQNYATTITFASNEITLLLIKSIILIDSSQITKIFDKKKKPATIKVLKVNLEKYQTENMNLLKKIWHNTSDAVKPKPSHYLRQKLKEPAKYYFKMIKLIS
jgi:hypothetical protein